MERPERNNDLFREVAATAREGLDLGLSVLPPKQDGSKSPATIMVEGKPTWEPFQRTPASAEMVGRWYEAERRTGIGLVCGKVSKDLELFEFDDATAYRQFKELADATGFGPLVVRIEAGYLECTPGGGYHWLYYCEEVRGSTKLAKRYKTPDECTEKDLKAIADAAAHGNVHRPVQTLIETKGEGGYVVIAPSYGDVHPSKKAYSRLHGSLESIASITPEERDELWTLARTMDQVGVRPEPTRLPKVKVADDDGGLTPWDDFNARATWEEVLEPHSWRKIYVDDGEGYWCRPGKERGISATTNHGGHNCLIVFTSSTVLIPWPEKKGYDLIGAYVALNHDGDFKAAAIDLRAKGYGTPTRLPRAEKTRAILPANERTEANGNGGGGGGIDIEISPPRFNLTDLGNAERLVASHGQDIRYCHPWAKWIVWDGRRWGVDRIAQARQRARQTVRAIYLEAAAEFDPAEREKVGKHAVTSEKKERIAAMLHVAEAEDGIPVLPEQMNPDPWLFNARNGTIDLRTGELRPHERGDAITLLCDLDYDPYADCPLWLATLDRFLHRDDPKEKEELIGFLQRLCGYAMVGLIRDHILPIAYGSGSNGKSTILGTLLDVFGPDYGMKAPPALLMAKKADGHPTELAALFGKRLVVAIETAEGGRLDEVRIKELTGGDSVSARRMREDFWEFKPTHTLMMATNHKPVVRGTDLAIWRRLKLIPFTVTMDEKDADVSMPEKLRNELPGILSWCVRGCVSWQVRGLDSPEEVTKATNIYKTEQDVLGAFLSECTLKSDKCNVAAKELYERYELWATHGNERVITKTAFGLTLNELGFQKYTSNGIRYRGIGLLKEHAPEESDKQNEF